MMHEHEPGTESPAAFTLTEAAVATQRSRITIRRYLDAGRFPAAFRDTSSSIKPAPWRIPIEDLERAGLSPVASANQERATPGSTGPMELRLAELQVALAVERARAEERRRTIELLDAMNQRLLDAATGRSDRS